MVFALSLWVATLCHCQDIRMLLTAPCVVTIFPDPYLSQIICILDFVFNLWVENFKFFDTWHGWTTVIGSQASTIRIINCNLIINNQWLHWLSRSTVSRCDMKIFSGLWSWYWTVDMSHVTNDHGTIRQIIVWNWCPSCVGSLNINIPHDKTFLLCSGSKMFVALLSWMF